MKELLNAVDVDMTADGMDLEIDITDKAVGIVQEAMKPVLMEAVIKLLDGTDHIVYITKCEIKQNGEIAYEFSTFDASRKEDLIPHIEIILKDIISKIPVKKKWYQ